jgi:putative oxidoreductase
MMTFKRSIMFVLGWTNRADWFGPLLMRIFFGGFWVLNGWGKVHDLAGFAQRFAGWGIPDPRLSAALSAYTELVGGVLLLLGLFTRLATLPLIFNMLVAIATVTVKQMHGLSDFILADEPLYVLILFWLLVAGPGKASLDHLICSVLAVHL